VRYTVTIIWLVVFWAGRTEAQQPSGVPISYKLVPLNKGARDSKTGSDGIITLPVRANCKAVGTCLYLMTQETVLPKTLRGHKAHPRKQSLIAVHGNILYDFDYWSNLDTPYAEKNINQQMLQTYLDLDYKNEYPFRVIFTTRWSNSSLFRDITDVSFQYNAGQFNNKVKRQALALLLPRYGARDSLLKAERELNATQKEFNALDNTLNGAGGQQRLVALKELLWLKSRDTAQRPAVAGGPPSLTDWNPTKDYSLARHGAGSSSADSGKSGIHSPDSTDLRRYDSLQRRLDSLANRLDSLQKQYQRLESLSQKNGGDAQSEISNITSGRALKEKLDAEHVSDSSLPKGYQSLYSVRSFGIGRTLLNYSELSAKNVSINGIQAEYNPGTYMAVAAGTVDYRFRDYSVQNTVSGQWLALMRYGWGKKDGNNIIFTYYTGKRQLYNDNTTLQGTAIPNYSLMGFTVEGSYKLSKTTMLTAEAAKSSLPYYSLDSSKSHDLLGTTLKLNDRSNEAYSLKIRSFIPFSQTQLSATYSRFGANFQSFSLFTTGTEQSAWSVRVDQPFLQKRLLVTGSIKTNDFTNPLLVTAYKSTAVFESIQATLRLKNWPTLFFGYFPSSQVMKLNSSQYQENLFYMMTATASESYKVEHVTFISMLMYTAFYNKVTDSGFIYFNTRNFLACQTAIIGKLTVQLQGSIAANSSYTLYVADGKADYRVFSWLSMGAGIKYNDQTVYDIRQWGYGANAAVRVPKIGEFRLMGDKGFIPGNNKQLVPNNLGRLTYSKVF